MTEMLTEVVLICIKKILLIFPWLQAKSNHCQSSGSYVKCASATTKRSSRSWVQGLCGRLKAHLGMLEKRL